MNGFMRLFNVICNVLIILYQHHPAYIMMNRISRWRNDKRKSWKKKITFIWCMSYYVEKWRMLEKWNGWCALGLYIWYFDYFARNGTFILSRNFTYVKWRSGSCVYSLQFTILNSCMTSFLASFFLLFFHSQNITLSNLSWSAEGLIHTTN